MSNFDYTMSADGSQALGVSDKIVSSLTGVESHAKKVGDAMTSGFHAGAVAAKSMEDRIEGAGVSIREFQAGLTRIHGPFDQLEKDLRVVNALQAEGLITANQYADELERIHKAGASAGGQFGPARDQAGPSTSSLSGIAGKVGEAGKDAIGDVKSQLLGLAAPAAIAAGALHEITQEFDNWKARKQDVREATNTILKFYSDIDGAKSGMAEQTKLSEDLGLNITKTARAYAAAREATEELGLTSKQVTDITRNLTAAIIVDGGSIEGVTTIMEKLQFANEQGFLSARDLKAIWQQSPEVIHSFEASLHKTYPELQKMAAEGKLTGKALETMTTGLGVGHEAIDKYRQRLLSVDQVMEENHVDMFKAVLLIADAKKGYEELGETAPETFARIAAETNHAYEVTSKLAEKLQLIMTTSAVQGNFATDKARIDEGLRVQAMLDGQGNRYQQFAEKVKDLRTEMTKLGYDAKAVDGIISQLHGPDWVDYYLQQLDQIRQPERDWAGRLQALNELLGGSGGAKITLQQYTDLLRKAWDQSPRGIEATRQMTAEIARQKDEIEAMIELKKSGVDIHPGIGLTDLFTGGSLAQASADARGDAAVLGAGESSFTKQQQQQEADARTLAQKYESALTPLQRYHEALAEIAALGTSIDEDTRKRYQANAEVKMWDETGAAAQKAAARMKQAHAVEAAAEEAFKSGVGDLGKNFVDAATGANVSWSQFFSNFAKNMASAIVSAELLAALGNSGQNGGAPSGLLGWMFGGGHASGGSYTAPETGGGQDSIPVMFRMNPGETATFTNKGQQPSQFAGGDGGGGGGGFGGTTYMTIHPLMQDERSLVRAVEGPHGQRVISNMVRRAQGAYRQVM
jgi:tape measure domain-containing protein